PKQISQERLKAENDYLLLRSIEIETNVNANLEMLNNILAQLQKVIVPNVLPQMLTVGQVAELYRVEERTVNGWVQERRIPFHKAGRSLRFRLDELLEWSKVDIGIPLDNVVGLPRSKRLQPRKGKHNG